MNEKSNKQTLANKKWQEKNKERTKFLNKRSTARTFIKKFAQQEDLEELKQLINDREMMLKK